MSELTARRRAIHRVRRLAWGRPQMGWRRSPVSRYYGYDRGTPIDRLYIDSFMDAHRADVHGAVLDIGDDAYTRRFGDGRVTRSDVLAPEAGAGYPGATVIGNLETGEGLPERSYDCFLLLETLSVIFDLRRAVAASHSLLKPGGVVLATSVGISPKEPDWTDYWRLTPASMGRLFSERFGAENVSVEAFGNVLSASAFLYGLAQEEMRRSDLEHRDAAFDVTVAVRAQRALD